MENAELRTLIRMRKIATDVLHAQKPVLTITLNTQQFDCAGKEAEDIAKGILVCVQAMEISADL